MNTNRTHTAAPTRGRPPKAKPTPPDAGAPKRGRGRPRKEVIAPVRTTPARRGRPPKVRGAELISEPTAASRDEAALGGALGEGARVIEEAPDLSAPDLSAPDLSAPDLSAPDLSAPDLSAPDLSAPSADRPRPRPPQERPHPASYLDHRLYLTHMTAYLKGANPSFSYRVFSQTAGFAAPNVLKLAADGDRSIAPRSIEKFALGLGLSADEHGAFEALVHFTQATSDVSKTRWYQRLLSLRARYEESLGGVTEALELAAGHFEAYSSWPTMMLRELTLWPEFVEDPQLLARLFRCKEVRASDLTRSLELLERLALCVRDEQGRLRAAQPQIKTPREMESLAVRNFHRALLGHAAESLDQVERAERNVSGLSLSLTPAQYEELTHLLADLRQDLLRRFEGGGSAPQPSGEGGATPEGGSERTLYHLSLALFPITRSSKTLSAALDGGEARGEAGGAGAPHAQPNPFTPPR
jgi:uncharacterized protein (TIGR02147 family)